MQIWLLTTGEPLPLDADVRLLRTGILANFLAEKGHEVTWWASTFNHFKNKHYLTNDQTIKLNKNITLKLVHAPGYKKSISIARAIDHAILSHRLGAQLKNEKTPDIIVASMPTIGFAYQAVKFGKRFNIPVLVDIRDLWPDVFVDRSPLFLKPLIKLFSILPNYKLKYALKNATGLVSVSNGFLSWGLKKINKSQSITDKVFPLAPPIVENKKIAPLDEVKKRYNVQEHDLVLSYGGVLRKNLDFKTVIQGLQESGIPYKLIVCGAGDGLETFKKIGEKNPNIFFTGWVNQDELHAVYSITHIALAPYKTTFDFRRSYTNKPIEYLSMGLPILTSLDGELRSLIEQHQTGWYYPYQKKAKFKEIISTVYLEKSTLNFTSKNCLVLYQQQFESTKIYTAYVNHLEFILSKPLKKHDNYTQKAIEQENVLS